MKNAHCPICYSELEVRKTTPCFICGCWHGDKLESEIKNGDFRVYGLENDAQLTLCNLCYLEEVLSNQGDLLESLNIKKEEAKSKIRFLNNAAAVIADDKYCEVCKKRLALLKVISNLKNGI